MAEAFAVFAKKHVPISARLNALSDNPVKSRASRVWNTTQVNAPNPRSVALSRHRDEAFAVSQSPNSSIAFHCAPVGFVNFCAAAQPLSSGSQHGKAHFVKHTPSSLIAAQPQIPLQGQGTQSAFLSSHEPHCAEPGFQRQLRILKNSSRDHRTRMAAGRTFQDASFHSPVFRPATPRAQKPIWPSQRFKVGATILLAFELLFEIRLIFGIDLCHSSVTTYGVTGGK